MRLYGWIEQVNGFLHPLIWGWPILAAILLVGANFSFRLGFFQFTKCKLWLKITAGNIFSPKPRGSDGISPFQALTTALAGSIGTGNIVGVATALTLGGPGAIFWMWVSALLGMMTIFAENVLGMEYRLKNPDGTWRGGAMYYIERGIHSRPLAVVFSAGCVLASFGMGNMAQSNSIAGALEDTFGIPGGWTGLFLTALLLAVTFGGIRRIARVTEKLVPFMALGYLFAAAAVLFCHRDALGGVLREIVDGAFGLRPAAGGVCASAMISAMKTGVSRGIFTNEAGLGSSVMAHSGSSGTEPVEQGMWGIFQVFVDTIVMCTVTALVILSSGAAAGGKDGAALSAAAFSTVFGRFGGILVSVSIALFAFATLLGWSYYGECGVRYLAGSRAVPPYRVLFALMAFLGCGMELRLVWDVCDTLNGFMAFPNLIALFLLSGEVVGETGRYLAARKDGKRRGAGPAKAGGKAPRPQASASRAGRAGLQKLQKRQGRKTRFL